MQNDQELYWQIRQADALFRRALHTAAHPEWSGQPGGSLRGHGHGKLLYTLTKSDGLSQKELAARLEIRPQSLTEALVRLEQEGYITRERSARDKREQFVRITPAGRIRAQEQHETRLRAVEYVFSGLTEQEKQELGRLLGKIIESFREREGESDV